MESEALTKRSQGLINAAQMASLLPLDATELETKLDHILGVLPRSLDDMYVLPASILPLLRSLVKDESLVSF